VYYPNPDLKIKNNFSHNILFVPYIDGKDLHFEVYGTPDDRTVDVTLPVVTERGDDGSLKTEFTQTVKDKNGATLIDKVFKSNYDSPDKYPHPGDIEFTEKPKDWSKKQWEKYKKEKGL
jgi:vancomycin resistance protein YoaR